MGNSSSSACSAPAGKEEELRLPWALAQAEKFESDDCPFCALRRSHMSWLRTEIKRLTSEVASLETTIPPKFLPELERRLQDSPLPDSMYTGGVDDVRGTACPRCLDHRKEVNELQNEARLLDAQCKARVEFHRAFARRIEALLIEKRHVEAKLFFGQQSGGASKDGEYCGITRVNQCDDDVLLALLKEAEGVDEDAANAEKLGTEGVELGSPTPLDSAGKTVADTPNQVC